MKMNNENKNPEDKMNEVVKNHEEEFNEEDNYDDLTKEEFDEMATYILPGKYLGEIEISGGATSSFCHTSAEKNEDGSYTIYNVPEQDGDYYPPDLYEHETITDAEKEEWLKAHGLEPDAFDDIEYESE